MFRVVGSAENARRVFLDYMRDINTLREHPRFYNTLTTNCTTMILAHTTVNPGHLPYSWKILLSGYTPEYAYDMGRLDRSLPFEELKRRAHINARPRPRIRRPTSRSGSERGCPELRGDCNFIAGTKDATVWIIRLAAPAPGSVLAARRQVDRT